MTKVDTGINFQARLSMKIVNFGLLLFYSQQVGGGGNLQNAKRRMQCLFVVSFNYICLWLDGAAVLNKQKLTTSKHE